MNKEAKVALVRCENYEYEPVSAAVEKGLNLLGGVGQFVKRGEKILLKPNILAGESPDKCIGPHPVVFRTTAEAFHLPDVRQQLSLGQRQSRQYPVATGLSQQWLDQ